MVVKNILIILAFLAVIAMLFGYRANFSKSVEIPLPSATPVPKQSFVTSSNGDMRLIMIAKPSSSSATLYSFSIADQSGKTSVFFSKMGVRGESMSLPQNSWSPSGKYIFIEDKNGYLTDYLVFKANGESFSTGEKYLNATTLFNQKVKNYNLKTITGWDDPVLMSVRTVDGPHFWFDVTSRSFIQLVR